MRAVGLASGMVVVGLVAGAPHAHGYSEEIHALIDERALPAVPAEPPPGADDMLALREVIWRAGATHPDARVRERFLFYYPTIERFDAWAFKDFLGFDPDKPVPGIDAPIAVDGRGVLPMAARAPDDDRRNQNRWAHDADRRVRLDRYGRPLPADPAQLDISSALEGTPSQTYAHYGLPKVTFSTSLSVLRKDPRRYAPVPEPRSFGADFAQLHTDLAICAASLGTPGGETLGWWFLGNAHHYVQDVANQIHTIVAVWDFGWDALVESVKQELVSLGGLLRSRPDLTTIGAGIVKNHHLLLEDLFAKRVRELIEGKPVHPAVADAVDAIARGDAEFERALDGLALGPDGEFARAITEQLIDVSSHEGAEVYRLIHGVAVRSLSKTGGNFDNGMDPDEFVRARPDARKLERFYRLQVAGFARAGSAVRRHVALYRAALEPGLTDPTARQARLDASARRLVATQVAWLDARAERLATYVPRPPQKETINWFVPLGLLVLLGAVVGGPTWWWRRRRRRRERDTAVRGGQGPADPAAGK